MQIPVKLLASLSGIRGFDKKALEAVHASSEQISSVRFNPAKINPQAFPLKDILAEPIAWSSSGYYLRERPSFTFDPLFHAGVYYVQEASSMFLEQVIRQTVDCLRPLRVLDLCASPGGKSTLLQSLISPDSLLVSNDAIKSRAAILEENTTKWGSANTVVTNNDPSHFARLENYFDIMVVDAPCSGSGLFRRDPQAVNEWSESNVQLCSQRQQRIIADAWPALRHNGLLIYATCSYSKEENEFILDWLMENFRADTVKIETPDEWNITETVSNIHSAYGYRFYPDKTKGEGFFIAALQKKEGDAFAGIKTVKNTTAKLTRPEEALVQPMVEDGTDLVFFKQKDNIIALPAGLQNEIAVLQSALYIKKAGVAMGKPAGKDLIPAHALAVSTLVNQNINCIELTRHQAIQYLRKEDIQLQEAGRGWALAVYQGYRLGWIKRLPNRVNNYYPKEWRIIKQPI
ncbi:MAG: RNA methyltransferase [Bacteroidota bacterium]